MQSDFPAHGIQTGRIVPRSRMRYMGGHRAIKRDWDFLTGLTGLTGSGTIPEFAFGCSESVEFRSGRLKSALHQWLKCRQGQPIRWV
jgi:hypothetical protein